jgi:hypothetical protein
MFRYWKKRWERTNDECDKLYKQRYELKLKNTELMLENAKLKEILLRHALISVQHIDKEFVEKNCPELIFKILGGTNASK